MLLTAQNPLLPIEFTQGDNVVLALLATDDLGNPQNLTGASLSSQIQGSNLAGVITFPNSQHALGNQVTAPGTFTLTLAAADTLNCGEGINKEILTQCIIAGSTTYFRGVNLLTVYGNTPVQ
jgi:hypothetical protein